MMVVAGWVDAIIARMFKRIVCGWLKKYTGFFDRCIFRLICFAAGNVLWVMGSVQTIDGCVLERDLEMIIVVDELQHIIDICG